jgi:hypothetical protein
MESFLSFLSLVYRVVHFLIEQCICCETFKTILCIKDKKVEQDVSQC